MNLTFDRGRCTSVGDYLYIQSIFYINEGNYRHKCKMNILSKDSRISKKNIDIKLLYSYPYNNYKQRDYQEYLDHNRIDFFYMVRSNLTELVIEEIERTGNWIDFRLEVLLW